MVVKLLENEIRALMTYMDTLDKSSKEYTISVASLCRMVKSYEELVNGAYNREVSEAKLFLEQEQQDAENDIKLEKLRNERIQLEDSRLAAELEREYEKRKDILTMREERLKFAGRLLFDGITTAATQKWLSNEFDKSYHFEEHDSITSYTTKDIRRQLPMILRKK